MTLVELLVVISIMGILMALLAGGARKAMVSANQRATLAEIARLSSAIETLKGKSGKYPPCMGAITAGAVAGSSFLDRGGLFDAYMRSSYPRFAPAGGPYSYMKGQLGGIGYAYNYMTATGQVQPLNIQYIDQGEALVFWLGGFPTPIDMSSGSTIGSRKLYGFNSDPTDPFRLDTVLITTTTSVQRTVPSFDFDESRLTDTDYDGWLEYSPPGVPLGSQMPPYVYFDAAVYSTFIPSGTATRPFNSFPTTNTQNAPYQQGVSYQQNQGWGLALPYAASEVGATPFAWVNPKTFQIIAAGTGGVYGENSSRITVFPSGNEYYGSSYGQVESMDPEEQDNLTNFADSALGDALTGS
jgi:type II secretory pathway pseudopilin PulG